MTKFLTTSQKILILIVLFFISVCLVSENYHPFLGCKKDDIAFEKESVKEPDYGSIPDSDEGKMIKYGMDIITDTYKYIGPDVKDTAMRYIGNNMDCQNCHYSRGAQGACAEFGRDL